MRRGLGSIYYHKASKKYAGQYILEGKKYTIYQKRNESITEFKRRFNNYVTQIINDTLIEKDNVSLDKLVTDYIEQRYKDGYVLPNTYLRNKETLKLTRKLCEEFWFKPIQKVTHNDINHSKALMRDYSTSTIQKVWALLNKGFQIAINRRIIQFNILNDETIQRPLSNKEKNVIQCITPEEEKKLRQVLNSTDDIRAKICLIQLNTGMRIGEVIARNIKDIDFQKGTLCIDNTTTIDEKGNIVAGKHTKIYDKINSIDKGARTIPLDTETLQIFKGLSRTIPINGYFFYNVLTKKFIDPKRVTSYLKNINERYGICNSSLSTHRLRHTKITRLQEAGANLAVIQKLVGHVEGSKITTDVYTDVSLDFMKQEISKMS